MSLIAQLNNIPLGQLKPASSAFAPVAGETNLVGAGNAAGDQLSHFLSSFLGFLTTLAGLMFLIYFIFAALEWITAGGEKGKIEHARQQMVNAALGLIIVIAAYGIAGIIGGVLGIDILSPARILQSLKP
ncbi:hypothetical protein C5B42_01845 [Candidatus Cerribacteria bacterium 'Amazon FNV 2010 28 9']|uniref:Uncharacterized protein n=1 Tax=Candidatus Cerribacteria bacterium 'Amazon FNV 2010 28 9' TaxID=2081795 RepID=A0A317JPI9_9BACT|nr:MAG: hypothetical protein C5B42_01845 [Candidatus Cerribacteria bacterium 'Amazon FNV 2010 28 9']